MLADEHGDGLPFRTWEWHVAWWSHFAQRQRWVYDTLCCRTFRDPSGRLVGVAPLMLTSRPRGARLALRVLDFIGPDPNITELRGILCDPAWAVRVNDALLETLRRSSKEWDLMVWRGLQAGMAARPFARDDLHRMKEIPDYILRLPSSWETFHSSRGRNLKESIRKCYNGLRREGLSFDFGVATDPRGVAAGLEDFFRLHGARACQTGTTPHRDVFESKRAELFLLDVVERLARRGMTRIFHLRIGGKPVAVRVGFAIGKSLYLYFSGFDPSWAKYSVMTTTLAESIRYAIGEGFETVNLSTGTDVSKTRWDPEKVTYYDAYEAAPSYRGRLALAAYRSLYSDRPLLRAVRRLVGRDSQ